jgi:5-methylcytosine-specific restriction endonuclease McrA
MPKFSFYNTKRWEKLREFVINRDGGMCVYCGAKGDTVHHIEWVNDFNCNDPMITFNVDNLETVCRDCHAKIHSKTGSQSTADGYRFDDEGNLIFIGKNKK